MFYSNDEKRKYEKFTSKVINTKEYQSAQKLKSELESLTTGQRNLMNNIESEELERSSKYKKQATLQQQFENFDLVKQLEN